MTNPTETKAAKQEQFGEGFIYAEDLLQNGRWSEFTLTIKTVFKPNTIKSQMDGKMIKHPVLEFEKAKKRLVLNVINQRLAKCAIGTDDPTKWPGHSITLYAAKGNWFGQSDVAAIRVRVPAGMPRPFINPRNLGADITGQKVE